MCHRGARPPSDRGEVVALDVRGDDERCPLRRHATSGHSILDDVSELLTGGRLRPLESTTEQSWLEWRHALAVGDGSPSEAGEILVRVQQDVRGDLPLAALDGVSADPRVDGCDGGDGPFLGGPERPPPRGEPTSAGEQ